MACVVAVVGATGVVGREMLRTLEAAGVPRRRVVALASPRSMGMKLPFRGGELEVSWPTPEAFEGVDSRSSAPGASASRELGPAAAARGAVVIDNSSAWRMDPDVPLVVPEVNMARPRTRPRGIIANPNCSTIQMVVALKPLHDAARLRHIVVSTYQAASGKGNAAVLELIAQARAARRTERPQSPRFSRAHRHKRAHGLEGRRGRLLRRGAEDGVRDPQDPRRRSHRRLARRPCACRS